MAITAYAQDVTIIPNGSGPVTFANGESALLADGVTRTGNFVNSLSALFDGAGNNTLTVNGEIVFQSGSPGNPGSIGSTIQLGSGNNTLTIGDTGRVNASYANGSAPPVLGAISLNGGTVTNNGIVTISDTDNGGQLDGFFMTGASSSFVNNGTLSVSTTNGVGVLLRPSSDFTFTNHGAINHTNPPSTTTGSAVNAQASNNNVIRMSNTGTIRSTSGTSIQGINALITNTGVIEGQLNAISIGGNNPGNNVLGLINSGTVRGRGVLNGGVGFRVIGDQSVVVSQSMGLIAGDSGIAIQTNDGEDNIFIGGGQILGNVDGGGGNDTVFFGATVDTDNLSARTPVNSPADTTLTFAGNFSDFETGSINAGSVYLNGTNQIAQLTVNGGGLFGGTGTTMGNVIVNSGGTLGPGNSIGTQTITGNVTFEAGSTLQIEVQGRGGAPTPMSDLLSVSGTANIDNGASVTVAPRPGIVRSGDTFNVLEAANIIGNFGPVIAPSATLSFSADVVVNQLSQLRLTAQRAPFSTLAATRNQAAVSAALDRFIANPTVDLGTVVAQLDTLTTPAALQSALTQIHPETVHGLRRTAFADANARWNILDQHLSIAQTLPDAALTAGLSSAGAGLLGRPMTTDLLTANAGPSDPPIAPQSTQLWAHAFVTDYHQAERRSAAGLLASETESDTRGTIVGFDSALSEQLLVGVLGAFEFSRTSSPNDGATGEKQSFSVGAYARRIHGPWQLDSAVVGGIDRFDARRAVRFGSIDRTAHSEYSGWHLNARLAGAYQLARGTHWDAQLNASGQFSHLDLNGYSETGADSLNLRFPAQSTDSLQSRLGAQLTGAYAVPSGLFGHALTLAPRARLAWLYEFLDNDQTIRTAFANAADSAFTITSDGGSRHAVEFSAGVTASLDTSVPAALHLEYFARYSANSRPIEGTGATLQLRF